MDPYQATIFRRSPYKSKVTLRGKLVVVLQGQVKNRGLELIVQPSRVICKNQVHELILTEQSAYPGDLVNDILYLGFVEFENGGVLVTGDKLLIGGREIGHVCGFDETHMPNHLNIVLHGPIARGETELLIGQDVVFEGGELGSIHAARYHV